VSREQPSVALTLTQPWGSLVVCGAKRLETRSWRTTHRGPLFIHAAKGFPRWARDLCAAEPFKTALRESAGIRSASELPLGALLGTVTLLDCVPTTSTELDGIGDDERAFGDYGEGRWAWLLAEPRSLDRPVPMKGALSLWQVGEIPAV